MILGIGSDLVDIRRIEKTIEKFGDRFIQRIYTPLERKKAEGRAERIATYAKRFAAKEACSKALGTGFRRGTFWRDMGVVNLPSGRPTMELTGGARAHLERIDSTGLPGADRCHHYGRISDRAGVRDDQRGSRRHGRIVVRPVANVYQRPAWCGRLEIQRMRAA